MSTEQSLCIAARLDRLPPSWAVWRMVITIASGGFFEFYDLFFTGYIAPSMVKAGLFTPQSLGVLAKLKMIAASGVGTFVFSTFAGLWLGSIVFSQFSDRFGRRSSFVGSLLWYVIFTAVMAFQTTGFWLDFWRFIADLGVGVQFVTISTYIAEIVPFRDRGRAFAVGWLISFLAVPVIAFLAWQIAPLEFWGLEGWRWVVLFGSSAAVVVLLLRANVPESPRWLARCGRLDEAEAIVADLERQVLKEVGTPLPAPRPALQSDEGTGRFSEIFSSAYIGRTSVLTIFNLAQTIGFYGFAAWVPSLLISRGIHITQSLEYSFIIAVANPVGPLLGMWFADRIERKWQLCGCAAIMLIVMWLFAHSSSPVELISLGVLFTLAANILGYTSFSYESELYPTRIRAKAIGFVFSWSRLSAAFSGLLIGYFLQAGGTVAVATFIAGAMLVVIVSIGVFGPRTKGRTLEEISGEARKHKWG